MKSGSLQRLVLWPLLTQTVSEHALWLSPSLRMDLDYERADAQDRCQGYYHGMSCERAPHEGIALELDLDVWPWLQLALDCGLADVLQHVPG